VIQADDVSSIQRIYGQRASTDELASSIRLQVSSMPVMLKDAEMQEKSCMMEINHNLPVPVLESRTLADRRCLSFVDMDKFSPNRCQAGIDRFDFSSKLFLRNYASIRLEDHLWPTSISSASYLGPAFGLHHLALANVWLLLYGRILTCSM
jgi:hypothetical protein